jgi:hypothetical protein
MGSTRRYCLTHTLRNGVPGNHREKTHMTALHRAFLPVTLLAVAVLAAPPVSTAEIPSTSHKARDTWTFVSMPDFLNVDTTYPQPGWEETLDYVLKAVKAENPDFVLVPGDLVMGRWWSEDKIAQYAALYYPAWIERMEAHGLKFYPGIGDHEIGDNPWPPDRAGLVPAFKRAFRDYLKMPLNGPEHMKGTAYYFVHKNTLFVSVDVFEQGQGEQGEIVAQVKGEQLTWLRKTLEAHPDVYHIVVMGHTPILGPVRRNLTSALMLEEGRRSPFWRTMVICGVDLYLCGEVHAITCIERDRIQQVVHGGLFGYGPKVNYLVAHVSLETIELELKEIDIVCEGEKLWQEGINRPRQTVRIAPDIRRRGYVSVGTMVIDKTTGKRITRDKTGYFDESDNPRE